MAHLELSELHLGRMHSLTEAPAAHLQIVRN